MKEEKLQILKMVEEGKINSEEGINLLETIEESEKSYIENRKAKWLKIKILDPDSNTKVNVTIPISLINIGIKMGVNFVPELKNANLSEDDLKEMFEAIEDGACGKIVDVESEDGEKVEIVVE